MDFDAIKSEIETTYKILEFNKGHIKNRGKQAYYYYKNPHWKIIDSNNNIIILMFCEPNIIFKLCQDSYNKILEFEKINNIKITWCMTINGYIIGNNNLYVHQIIMDCYGNGKGTKNISVDHIDRNPLNNCYNNLRIATFEEQQNNSKGILPGTKRERKQSAKDLPECITQEMMKKYVVYYHEWLNKEHTKKREFFKVEKHPKLDKPWMTTKSEKVSIQEKLKQANKVVDDLENNIYSEKENIKLPLPKYISLVNIREKNHLVFEKRIDGLRLNLKMVLPIVYDLQEQLEIFKEKINFKYKIKLNEEILII